MKLYLLKQNVLNHYDTYDSCIVCANSEEDAINIRPDGEDWNKKIYFNEWPHNKSDIVCIEIGIANPNLERGVVLSSFNAG